MIELDGVFAGYGGGDVLQGVDLCGRAPASITCIVGPNGAGKSTVLRAISGLLRPRDGRDHSRRPAHPRPLAGGGHRRRRRPGARNRAGCSAT